MGGVHQVENAVTAIETVEALREQGFAVPEDAVKAGLGETIVPGRIQILQENPLVILDGGHNADGTAVLMSTLAREKACHSEITSYIGICGMTGTKDADTHREKFIGSLLESFLCGRLHAECTSERTACRIFPEISHTSRNFRSGRCSSEGSETGGII